MNVKLLKIADPPGGPESLILRAIKLVAENVVSLTAAEAPLMVICWVALTVVAVSVYSLAFGTVPEARNAADPVLWMAPR